MEKIQQGKYVEMVYDLYKVNADGSEKLVHQSDEADPERFVYGVTPGMIRFSVGIENPEDIKAFEGLDYRYSPEHSDDGTYVFVRQKEEKLPEFE